MKVMVACEFSGTVRDAFIRRGHDAVSCDINGSISGFGPHIKADIRTISLEGYDLMICHPSCRYLAVSGARYFADPERQKKQIESLDFVRWLLAAPVPRICLENPVSVISTKIKKPSQIVHPWEFGDTTNKTICFWYKNLPKLVPTKFIPESQRTNEIHETKVKNGFWRRRARSIFFRGLADAMADQWSFEEVIKVA